jgi:hypothetical protein
VENSVEKAPVSGSFRNTGGSIFQIAQSWGTSAFHPWRRHNPVIRAIE